MAKPPLGPAGPWLSEEEDETVYPHVRTRVLETLLARLHERMLALQGDDTDAVVREVRRQVAEAAVDWDTTKASDLHTLLVELLMAKEHTRRI